MDALKISDTWNFLIDNDVELPYKQRAEFVVDSKSVTHGYSSRCISLLAEGSYTKKQLDLNELAKSNSCIKKNCVSLLKHYPTLKQEFTLLQMLSKITKQSKIESSLSSASLRNYIGSKSFIELFGNTVKSWGEPSDEARFVIKRMASMLEEDRSRVLKRNSSKEQALLNEKAMKEYICTSSKAPVATLKAMLGPIAHSSITSSKELINITSKIRELEPVSLSQFREESFSEFEKCEGGSARERLIQAWRNDVRRVAAEIPASEVRFLESIESDKRRFLVDLKREINFYHDEVLLSLAFNNNWRSRVVVTDSLTASYLNLKYRLEVEVVSDSIAENKLKELVELSSVLIAEQEEVNDLKLALLRSWKLLDA